MKTKLKYAIIPLLALSLAACGATSNSKQPTNYKTPAVSTTSPTIKVGDKCKKSGEKKTVNNQKLICKSVKVGSVYVKKWKKA